MKVISIGLLRLLACCNSCTIDKTDFEAELHKDTQEFHKAYSIRNQNYEVILESLAPKNEVNAELYQDYNLIRFKIIDLSTGKATNPRTLKWIPTQKVSNGNVIESPHSSELTYNEKDQYYYGYCIFTKVATADSPARLTIIANDNANEIDFQTEIQVQKQLNSNRNMTEFEGKDGFLYTLALLEPQLPKQGSNAIVASLFKSKEKIKSDSESKTKSTIRYSLAKNYRITLNPRIPDASMGNHSSPNNKDLTQGVDGFYHGTVNYTMSGIGR